MWMSRCRAASRAQPSWRGLPTVSCPAQTGLAESNTEAQMTTSKMHWIIPNLAEISALSS